MKELIVICILIICLFSDGEGHPSTSDANPIVEIDTGKIQGFTDSFNGVEYYGFLGVPYAQVAVRFRRSVFPHPSWDNMLRATQIPNNCWQIPFGFPVPDAPNSEDCLGMNVYVPKGDTNWRNRKLPVMFVIHSHGYERVNGASYPADYVLSETRDVIIVTFNFRVGVWGFLFTGDDAADRNVGFWDIQYALEWTYANIEKFGGDSSDITVNGFTSGGSFAQNMALMDRNRGKIRKTILSDEGVGVTWHLLSSCRMQQSHIDRGERIAASVGCPTSDHYAMVDCLRNTDNQLLLEKQNEWDVVRQRTDHKYAVVPEPELIPDVFYRLYKYHRVQDDVLVLSSFGGLKECVPGSGLSSPAPYDTWEEWFLNDYKEVEHGNYEEMYNIGLKAYNTDANASFCDHVVRFGREFDRGFSTPLELSMEYHSKFSSQNVYHARLKHVASYDAPQPEGYHGSFYDVIFFAYGFIGKFPNEFGVTQDEVEVARRLIRMQYNFVRTGDPNVGQDIGPVPVPLWRHNDRKSLISQVPYQTSFIDTNTVGPEITKIWKKGFSTQKLGTNGCIAP